VRKKILVIADRRGWAYEVIAKAIAARLPEYEWSIGYANAIDEINETHQKWDLIFAMGWKWPNREIRTPREKTVSVVHSFRTLKGKDMQYWGKYLNERYCAVGAINLRILELLSGEVDKILYTPNGVDTDLFSHSKCPLQMPIKAGWAGRGDDPEFRGIPIMQEACDRAGIVLRIQSAKEKQLTHKEMVTFYHGLHLYLNMSESEGCSCTMLEAASCGVPCIATNTGVSTEMITSGQTGYIVDRNVDSLTNVLQKMTLNRCAEMGQAMRKRIVDEWSWGHQVNRWNGLIRFGLEYENEQ